jgi:myo-inositol-1(or 4)-monophosphatase
LIERISMINTAISAARQAGQFLHQNIGNVKHVERKLGQDTNLVTELDRRAEEIIIAEIQKSFPDHDILAEESGSHEKESSFRWVIDPLDGTTNYTHGLPLYCVSIGLEVDGMLTLGVVYDPSRDELFTAEKGKGAFLNGSAIRVSRADALRESLLVTGFPYDLRSNPDRIVWVFEKFLMEAQAVRRLGSAALDLCYVAAGRFDGYWEFFLNPWDMAAGVLLLQEAGGNLSNFEGSPTTIYQKNVLATNGMIHSEMVRILRD